MALEVFRASQPRRGDQGRDDRLLLGALHYFAVHIITRRTLPERFGEGVSRREVIYPLLARLSAQS